jgi:ABC-type multidrug transport system fused ATPase/permease subunit
VGKIIKILGYAKIRTEQIILLFLLAILSSYLMVIPTIILGNLSNTITDQLNSTVDIRLIFSILLIYAGVLIFGAVLRNVFCYVTSRLSNQIIFRIKSICHEKLLKLDSEKLTLLDFGGVTNQVLRNAERLELVFSTSLFTFISDIFDLLIMSYFLFRISPIVLAIFILVLPITYFLAKGSGKEQRNIAEKKIESETESINQLSDTYHNFDIVRVFHGEGRERAQFIDSIFHYRNLSNEADKKLSSFFVSEKFVRVIGTVLALGFVIAQILQNKLDVGSFLIVALYSEKFFSPVTHMIRYLQQIQKGSASIDSILDFLSWTEHQPGCGVHSSAMLPLLVAGEDLILTINGKCVGRCKALKIVDKEINLIIGDNGSGKTSLVKMLMGLIDRDANRIDLDESLMDEPLLFSYVPQDAPLFNISLIENCLYPQSLEESDQDVIDRVKTLLEELNFPREQFDKKAGEMGTELSGGERKKISLIRAVVHDSPILILDEILANVDAPSINKIEELLLSESADRAIVLISHRVNDAFLSHCTNKIMLTRDKLATSSE